jgi:hypothetical protein
MFWVPKKLRGYADHTGGWCSFEPTNFSPVDEAMVLNLEKSSQLKHGFLEVFPSMNNRYATTHCLKSSPGTTTRLATPKPTDNGSMMTGEAIRASNAY